MYTPGEEGVASLESGEEAVVTYIYSEQENPWTVLDTGHLYRRTGEQEEQ